MYMCTNLKNIIATKEWALLDNGYGINLGLRSLLFVTIISHHHPPYARSNGSKTFEVSSHVPVEDQSPCPIKTASYVSL